MGDAPLCSRACGALQTSGVTTRHHTIATIPQLGRPLAQAAAGEAPPARFPGTELVCGMRSMGSGHTNDARVARRDGGRRPEPRLHAT